MTPSDSSWWHGFAWGAILTAFLMTTFCVLIVVPMLVEILRNLGENDSWLRTWAGRGLGARDGVAGAKALDDMED